MHSQTLGSGRRAVIGWAMYDWANSTFATTVMAGFFPLFLNKYWSAGSSGALVTFHLGMANGLASLVIVVLAPILGAIADQGGLRKRYLLGFAALGIVMTAGLYFVQQGDWLTAVVVYGLAVIGFSGGNIFYDALLVNVADVTRWDRVSALGYALGYLGGGLLFAVNVLMTLKPGWFALSSAAEAVRLSFVMVALWWAVFSLPLLFRVKEPPALGQVGAAVRGGLRQLVVTFRTLRHLRVVFLFLIAYWLYIDGVNTIIRMAVDYGLALGFAQSSLITALLITQFVGFPAAIGFGLLGQRMGPRNGILLGIVVYMGVIILAYRMTHVREFYLLAVAIGLVQGGVQSLSRSLYARLIPVGKSAEFFGFYNMLGKFAAVLGPMLMGIVSLATGSVRLSILSVMVLFIAGVVLLLRVNVPEGERIASQL